jgi:hypothetical protein
MFFYRVATRILNYFVEPALLSPKLEKTGLLPCRFFNGKAMVSLTFFNYQEVTVGPYDEVVVSFVVYPEGLGPPSVPTLTLALLKRERFWQKMGMYVLEMPVTIPGARAAGREIWGYPKFLTEITHEFKGKQFSYTVHDPEGGNPIVSLEAEMVSGLSGGAFDLTSFTHYEISIWRTTTDVRGRMTNAGCKWSRVTTNDSKHPMAVNIRDLGLENAKPFMVMSSDYLRTRLNAGKPVAEWISPRLPYGYPEEQTYLASQQTVEN